MSQLSPVVMASFKEPPRGREVFAVTNTFKIDWNAKGIVYYYDVFEPQWDTTKSKKEVKIGKEKRIELLDHLQKIVAPQDFREIGAFDGQCNLYTWGKYPFESKEFPVPWIPGRSGPKARSVNITIKLVQTIHSELLRDFINASVRTPQMKDSVAASLNMLNIYVQAKARQGNLSKATSFYIHQGSSVIGGSMKPLMIYPGLFQSVKLNLRGELLLNVDVTMAAVVPETSLSQLCFTRLKINSTRDVQRLSQRSIHELEMFIRGLKVLTPNGQTKTIKKVISNVDAYEFEKKNKDTGQPEILTIKQYFKTAYNFTVEKGELGVRCGGNDVFPIGRLTVKEQLYKPRLPPDGVKSMMDSATRNPDERLKKIEAQWNHLAYDRSEYLSAAGVQIHPSPIRIRGLQLDQPPIAFGGVRNAGMPDIFKGNPDKRGQWDVMRRRFLSTSLIDRVLILDVTGVPGAASRINTFRDDLRKEMENKGRLS